MAEVPADQQWLKELIKKLACLLDQKTAIALPCGWKDK
jgi:hypothetical protein